MSPTAQVALIWYIAGAGTKLLVFNPPFRPIVWMFLFHSSVIRSLIGVLGIGIPYVVSHPGVHMTLTTALSIPRAVRLADSGGGTDSAKSEYRYKPDIKDMRYARPLKLFLKKIQYNKTVHSSHGSHSQRFQETL